MTASSDTSGDSLFTVEDLSARIALLQRFDREALKQTLRELRTDLRKTESEEGAEDVLRRLLFVMFVKAAVGEVTSVDTKRVSKRARARNRDWYRRERLRIQSRVDSLAKHPLVARLHWDVYAIHEFRCEHRRYRKDCQEAREALCSLRIVNGPGIVILAGLQRLGALPLWHGGYGTPLVGRALADIRHLKVMRVSVYAKQADFCLPIEPSGQSLPIEDESDKKFEDELERWVGERDPVLREPKKGRPPKTTRHELVETMVGILREKDRLTIEKSCEYAAAILRDVYRVEVDATALRKALYRGTKRNVRDARGARRLRVTKGR